MFDFFEVPSQMMAAYGPVANGVNFDWSRQDTKPGLMNLNLIMDEEVFFSVVGRQTISQANGQYQTGSYNTTMMMTGTLNNQFPSDQFTQSLLNFDQLWPWTGYRGDDRPADGLHLPAARGHGPGPIGRVVDHGLGGSELGLSFDQPTVRQHPRRRPGLEQSCSWGSSTTIDRSPATATVQPLPSTPTR